MGSTISAQLGEFMGRTTFMPAGEQLWAVTNYCIISNGLRLLTRFLGMGYGSWWLLETYSILKERILGSKAKVLVSSLSVVIQKTMLATSIQLQNLKSWYKLYQGGRVFFPLGNHCVAIQKGIQTIQLMKAQGQQQFNAEKNLIEKALRTMVASKHEIRVHFLNNNTLHVRRKVPDSHSSTKNVLADHQDQQMQSSNPENQPPTAQHVSLSHKEGHSIKPKQDFVEVVYRTANKMQSIGWHEELQARRTSNMSRTFRRRRKSNLQDYTTLHHHIQPQDNESKSRVLKSSRLTINNLELSGFTNNQILQKSTKSIEFPQPPKPAMVKVKHAHILALIEQRNRLKIAQSISPIAQPAKGVFSIAVDKLNKKWKFQCKPEGSQSAREMNNSTPYSRQIQQSEASQPVSSQCRREKGQKDKTVQQQNVDNIFFLQQLKPSHIVPIQRQKSHSKRAYSQFIRSRPKYLQKYSPQRVHIAPEEGCRPWSVLRNLEDKIEEGKPSLDEPISG